MDRARFRADFPGWGKSELAELLGPAVDRLALRGLVAFYGDGVVSFLGPRPVVSAIATMYFRRKP